MALLAVGRDPEPPPDPAYSRWMSRERNQGTRAVIRWHLGCIGDDLPDATDTAQAGQ